VSWAAADGPAADGLVAGGTAAAGMAADGGLTGRRQVLGSAWRRGRITAGTVTMIVSSGGPIGAG
jgi:hypothetical protein